MKLRENWINPMINIAFNYQEVLSFVSQEEIRLFEQEVALHRENIYNRTGKGHDFLGWVDLPGMIDESLIRSIESDAARLRSLSDVIVVVGIGGSYLGSRAVIESLKPAFLNGSAKEPQIVYAGHHLDEDYLHDLLAWLENKRYAVIVISKSGTTTEPAVAFRLLKAHLESKVGAREASSRIVAITDSARGALKELSDQQSYTTYEIPDDVGGRFSVLTAVGLLPIAVAGFDIRKLLEGARRMADLLRRENRLDQHPAALYAVIRNILYRKGKTTEILAAYKPSLHHFAEWWKQLFGESEGKQGKGIFPASVGFTTDLHSMGQYIQDGHRHIFETIISIEKDREKLIIPEDANDLDGLNYLKGKRIGYVNKMAMRGTMMAHLEGDVPNLEIVLPELNENNLGELIYFFEMACAISGYILDVNPFDQPGVEAYKKKMFGLLGKPGY